MTEPRRLGGVLALRETWCRPDEKILWCCNGAKPRFDIPKVNPDGSTGGKPLDTIVTVLDVASFLTSEDGGPDGDRPPTPAVLVSGPGVHCEAARLAYTAAAEPGLWVLTSQRFAYVSPVPAPEPRPAPQERGLLGKLRSKAESVRTFVTGGPAFPDGEPIPVRPQRSVFELHGGQFTAAGSAVRTRPRFAEANAVFEKFVLADGSTLEFHTGPAGGVPRHRQTGRLLPLDEQDK